VDALKEERLIMLGPVLDRFKDEGLDPALKRIFGIGKRAKMFPPAPESLKNADIEVDYVSILSAAQRAAGTIAIERYLGFSGQMAGVWPEVQQLPDVDALMREYAEGIGLKASGLRSREDLEAARAADEEQQQLAQAAETGQQLAQGAQVLSNTDVGGGQNALQALL